MNIYVYIDIDIYNIYYSYYLQFTDYTTPTICVTWNPLYVWHHRNSIWHHTHSLWHNNTVSMTSHPLYSWQHTTVYDITYFILETSQRLYLWQDPSCVYDIIISIYDISHGVWMTTKPWYLTSHSQYLCNQTQLIDDIIPYLCMKSLPLHVGHHVLLCKTSQLAFMCHHMHFTWHNIQPLRQQPLVFMTSHALYWWHHMQYIWHVIYCVWCHIHYMCDITQCLYLWHQKLYVYDISTLYDITHSVMKTQLLCNFTATMPDITFSEFLILHTMYQFYEK